jgi:hypothetical protein
MTAGPRPRTVTRRRLGAVTLTAFALLLAGCSAHTTGATNVASQSATLNASGDCNGSSTPCSWYWRWGPHGSGYTSTSQVFGPVPVNWSGNVSYTATGLQMGTGYDFQICGYAQGAWQKCVGPDGTENTYGQFTTASPQDLFWYQSTSSGGRIATDPNGGFTTTSVGANYLLPSSYVQGRNGVDAPASGGDKCTTNGTGRMETWATDIGTNGSITGLAVPSSQHEITTSTASTRNPLCQANGSTWGFNMDAQGQNPANGCASYCNMQHSVSFDTCNQPSAFNCRPWSASRFGTASQVILASNYNAYRDCTVANGNGCSGDYHAYMCMWLQDTSQSPHPVLEYCVEMWRDRFTDGRLPGGASRYDSAAGFYETVVGGDGGVISWTRAEVGTAYATKCTVTATCPLSSSTSVMNNALGSRSYSVTISASQLSLIAQDINNNLGRHYSTNASDYELVGTEDGNEGGGSPGYLGSNVSGLTVATAY